MAATDEFNDKEVQDAIQLFDVARQMCNELSLRKLEDAAIQSAIHDLARYCKAGIQQCHLQMITVDREDVGAVIAVREQIWHGLSKLGFDHALDENQGEKLWLLLDACKRKIVEVATMLDQALNTIDEAKSCEQIQQTVVKTETTLAEDSLSVIESVRERRAAIKAVRERRIAEPGPQYMAEREDRMEAKMGLQLQLRLAPFGEYMSKVAAEASIDEEYPWRKQTYAILAMLSELHQESIKWARKTSDPLYVQVYENKKTPYKEDWEAIQGHGSFSLVFKAKNVRTGKAVAVKRLGGLLEAQAKSLVRKELILLEACDHPNVIKLVDAYEVGNDSSIFYLVMEPWAPYTLQMFLRHPDAHRQRHAPWFSRGSYDTERYMFRLLCDLANGLGYLHSKSIKHKDIKPDNILLYSERPGEIRAIITDLGVSRIMKKGASTD